MDTAVMNRVAEVKARPVAVATRKPLRLFVLKLIAVPGWVALGGFLAWLVHDFGQTSGFSQERSASFLVLLLFLISGALISMISWNSYRISSGKPSW
jgi:hypothetical protein